MANPPKPLELKKKLGNPGRRPLPKSSATVELVPQAGAPVPISLGPAGVAMWHRAQQNASWLASHDLTALEDWCRTWEEIADLRALIGEQGLSLVEPIVTPAGHVVGEKIVANPLLKELRAAQKAWVSQGSALGFDPTSRSRLGIQAVKAESLIDKLAKQRRSG